MADNEKAESNNNSEHIESPYAFLTKRLIEIAKILKNKL